MDFYRINERSSKESVEIYPDFKVVRSKDLMIRAKSFYAIWDEERGLWSTDEYDVQRLIDQDLIVYKKNIESRVEGLVKIRYAGNFSSGIWRDFRSYVGLLSNSSHQLDENLTFSNTEVKKTDYVSKRLPYPLAAGDISAYDELIGTLYDEENRAKIEWAIGAIISGDSKRIQKFLVFYGPPGSGKSTILDIILKLFVGYSTTFDAKSFTSGNSQFSMDVFKSNPLVAVQHDGDLSKIADNTKLNSIVAHEMMRIEEKFKPSYDDFVNAFLFMATNKPVMITDAKSGIIRRMIDVQPSGNLISHRKYQALVSQIDFELGAIAQHCLEVYQTMGKKYYGDYRPIEMMLQTDVFYNYIEAYYDVFRDQGGVTLNQAYDFYKVFCEDTLIEYKLPKYKFREELRNYFGSFDERAVVDGVRVRSWYSDFLLDQFKVQIKEEPAYALVMEETESLFDKKFADCPAQYAKADGSPSMYWADVKTTLKDLDTTKEHYVQVPENDIVIDFDVKDANGEKSAELNIAAASKWPPTYSEFSKSEAGIHLHYNYVGDVSELSRVYADNIEVKVYVGNSALRRKYSRSNNVPVANLSSGLPLKEKKVINVDHVKSEKSLRELVERNLRKEIHPGTKSSIDFIHKILEDAYATDLPYDLTDMRGRILAFGNNSSNQNLYCIKLVQKMKFASKEATVDQVLKEIEDSALPKLNDGSSFRNVKDERPVLFDVEVFPNLFVVCWKYLGTESVVKMINPTAQAIEGLFALNLVGFNNRRYDNHMLYARYMGYNNEQMYRASKKIIDKVPGCFFGEAYELSYADIYDFSSKKQGLKKFEIELGIPHQELGLPWDEPVPEDMWDKVVEYCCNDVEATEAVFIDRKQDFVARQILADLSGLSLNATTQAHTSKIVFRGDRKAQDQFVYTDLSEEFPGYVFEQGKSSYRGEDPGEGGYVYAEPGMYENVALLDIESMHPTTMDVLNMFGAEYTKNFVSLLKARLAIKHGDYESAKKMLGGMLAKHLTSPDDAKALSYALKIVINIVYGLTSARFDNPFKDKRNIDNIVAKRGALFMIDLKHAVQEQGFIVAHIKTDSIKIPNATPEIIEFVMEFGQKYGYNFEHEETYEKFCLVNSAVYVAKTKAGRTPSHWVATGAQFQHPYVFKTLFSKEAIEFRDLCEPKFVQTSLYLDFNTDEDVKAFKNSDKPMALDDDLVPPTYDASKMQFIGKAGLFCPILPGRGGALLQREKDGKFHAASGSSGYRWMEADMVESRNMQDDIDRGYVKKLVDDAVDNISQFGDFNWFVDA